MHPHSNFAYKLDYMCISELDLRASMMDYDLYEVQWSNIQNPMLKSGSEFQDDVISQGPLRSGLHAPGSSQATVWILLNLSFLITFVSFFFCFVSLCSLIFALVFVCISGCTEMRHALNVPEFSILRVSCLSVLSVIIAQHPKLAQMLDKIVCLG